jgi:type I site-specific restriction endonuclease
LQKTLDESEWQTRKERIDTRLRSCNPSWQVVPWRAGLDLSSLRCHAVTEFPTANGPADYALFVNGKLLGVIEAKRVTVTSQKLERYGKFDSAEDYLDAFERFVRANADKVAALGVLLQHPKDWRPAVMEELTRALSQNGFETEKLQRAHRAKGFKALADVISIVKHAAAQQAALFTAEERVNRAMDRFARAHELTTEQVQWLTLVREHLVQNLSMEEEDFDLTPLLEMRGGKAKARKVFSDLPRIVADLNEAVAA